MGKVVWASVFVCVFVGSAPFAHAQDSGWLHLDSGHVMGDISSPLDVVLDDLGGVHAVAVVESIGNFPYEVLYFQHDGTGWISESIAGSVSPSPDVAIHLVAGMPAVAWSEHQGQPVQHQIRLGIRQGVWSNHLLTGPANGATTSIELASRVDALAMEIYVAWSTTDGVNRSTRFGVWDAVFQNFVEDLVPGQVGEVEMSYSAVQHKVHLLARDDALSLFYIHGTIGAWTTEPLPAVITHGGIDIAVNAAGFPRVAYRDAPADELVYGFRDANNGPFTFEVVEATTEALFTELDLTADVPRIAWMTNGVIRVSTRDGTWSTRAIVEPCAKDGVEVALPSGDIGFHVRGDEAYVFHTRYDVDANVEKEVVALVHYELDSPAPETAFPMPLSSSPHMVLDEDDRPWICAFWDNGAQIDFVVEHYDGTQWVRSTLDSNVGTAGTFGHSCNIDTFDAGGTSVGVAVSYYHGLDNELNYAESTNGGFTWDIDTVATGGEHNSLVMLAGQPHISWSSPIDLFYSTRMSGVWSTTLVDTNAGPYNSMAAKSDGTLGISYWAYATGEGELRYAEQFFGVFGTSTVPNTTWMGWDTGLAFDSGDDPHISFFNYFDLRLMLASQDQGVWSTQVVDTNYVGETTSIAFDSNDNWFISYYDGTNNKLRLAKPEPFYRDDILICEVADGGIGTSVKLDKFGNPRIAHADTTGILRYHTLP